MIYFIQNKETKNIKIGYSENTKKRQKGLQTGIAEDLVLLVETEGTTKDEDALHKRFSHLRINSKREWFSPGKDLLKYIAGINNQALFKKFLPKKPREILPKKPKEILPLKPRMHTAELTQILGKLEEMRIGYIRQSKENTWAIMDMLRRTEGKILERISIAYSMISEEIKLERKKGESLVWDEATFDDLED